jgi:hypothetical protein
MTDLTEALGLYDTAARIDRLHFQLLALPAALDLPSLPAVSEHIRALAEITAGISDHVSHLSDTLYTTSAQRAADEFSSALSPLGEALTELGQLQNDAVLVHTTAPHTNTAGAADTRELAIEVITEHRDAAANFLQLAARDLRTAATCLAPATGRSQAAARAPPFIPTPATTPPTARSSPTPTPVVPARAKGR